LADAKRRTVYGRRRGKPLRPGQERLVGELLPQLEVDRAALNTDDLDPASLFGGEVREVWLEVGFGAGEHLAAQAAAHPDIGFIGIEPYINGVARLLGHVEERGLTNVRVMTDDAAMLLAAVRPASLGRAFLLFPDPWPKRRHHKRRFVRPENIGLMARALADGALWRMATDDMGYCRWMLRHMTAQTDFDWPARRPGDWRQRAEDWPATRYERKAIAQGRRPAYLTFRRKPRNNA
jgi:tRNA (guanine-N7-)-methyltransferase